MNKMRVGLIAFLLVLFIAPGAQALIIPHMTLEEMVTRADTIVTGRGEQFHIHPGHDGKVIYAFITFKVDEYLKNDLGEEEIVIMQIAQERSPDGKVVSGSLALKMDEEVVLFLTEEDHQGFRHVFGLSQGKFSVTQDWLGRKRLIQEMKGVRLYDIETGKIYDGKNIRIKLPYEAFKTLVTRIASRIEAKKETFSAIRPNSFF